MACPITVSKFVGTVSLGLLTGLSYSTSAITIPALKLLPTASTAARCLGEVKRLNRKHALRLSGLANTCLVFAYTLSSSRRKHPFLMWMTAMSALSSFGFDFLFNRHLGFKQWACTAIYDTTGFALGAPLKEDDYLFVDGSETKVNGESVEREMDRERRLQSARAWLSGMALSVGVVGLWGDRKA